MRTATPTPNGVIYDVEHSPYTSTRLGVLYRFSSAVHRDKFEREVVKREEWLCDSLSRRFHVKVDARVLAGLQLYQQIEKRGYSITDIENGVDYQCPETTQFTGHLESSKTSNCELSSTTMLLG